MGRLVGREDAWVRQDTLKKLCQVRPPPPRVGKDGRPPLPVHIGREKTVEGPVLSEAKEGIPERDPTSEGEQRV